MNFSLQSMIFIAGILSGTKMKVYLSNLEVDLSSTWVIDCELFRVHVLNLTFTFTRENGVKLFNLFRWTNIIQDSA